MDHIFVACSFAQVVRALLALFLKISMEWKDHTLLDYMNSWTKHIHNMLYLPFYIFGIFGLLAKNESLRNKYQIQGLFATVLLIFINLI